MTAILTRPRPDAPIYELRRTARGYLLLPYFADQDAGREISRAQAAEWLHAVRSCPGGLVIGDDRHASAPEAPRKDTA
jgi:hypothetical protein